MTWSILSRQSDSWSLLARAVSYTVEGEWGTSPYGQEYYGGNTTNLWNTLTRDTSSWSSLTRDTSSWSTITRDTASWSTLTRDS